MKEIKYTIEKTTKEERTAKFDNDNFISLLTYNYIGMEEYVAFIRYKVYHSGRGDSWTYKITISDDKFKVERDAGSPELNAERILKWNNKSSIILNKDFLWRYSLKRDELKEIEWKLWDINEEIENE